jgi:plastocyanin
MKSLRLIIFTFAVAAAGCGGDDGPSNPNDGGDDANTVTVSNNLFTPSSLTVPVGTTVTWQWNSGGVAHNVTFDDGIFSDNLSSGTYPRTFSTAGPFPYECTIHPGMAGTVTVTAGSTDGTGTGGGTGGGGTGGGDYP